MKRAWLAVIALAAIMPASARADELNPELPPEQEAQFGFVLNHVPQQDLVVILKDGDVLVDRADLRAAGLQPLGGRDVSIGDRELLSLRSVSPPLRYELDEREIVLRIVAPPELLPRTAIDLAARPPEIQYTSDPSGFLNYAPRLSDAGTWSMYQETGASVEGTLLFSSAYLSSTDRPIRGLTNFTLDDREDLTRIVIGDELVRTSTLGASPFIGGVTITRSYALDPYAIKTPRLGFVGSTTTPATLDVYINGGRVRSEAIAPGTFELTNLDVGGGSGVATYVIRDAFGNETAIADPFYASEGVLAKGVFEHTYCVGLQRGNVGVESWDYGRPAAIGRHRVGITNELTLGARAEAAADRVNAGPSLTAATPLGEVDVEVAASAFAPGGGGVAAAVSYGYGSRRARIGVFGRVASDRYSNLALSPADDRVSMSAGMSAAVPVASRVTLAYRGTVSHHRDRGLSTSIGLQSGVRLFGGLSWLVSGSRNTTADADDSWEVLTTLMYSFGSSYGAQVTGTDRNGALSGQLDTSKSLPSGEGFGYRASGELGETKRASGELQYQAQFGRYAARYSWQRERSELGLDAAGALVVVPGVGVFPTLPVQGGYGVIQLDGVPNVRGFGNHQEVGTTNSDGNLLVPNLLSYYGNVLSIAPEDVPMEYQLDSTEETLAPPPRGVAIARFRATMPHFFRGRFAIDDHGKRIVPEYGQARITQGKTEVISPLGLTGEFELEGLSAGKHTAVVEHAGEPCTFELTIPESEETVVELGELVCAAR